MYEGELKIECKNPELIKNSLKPDIEKNENVETKIFIENKNVRIQIKCNKLNHLKAIINSYISLIMMLIEAEKME